MSASEETVLVVDDEEELTDLYATWLEQRFSVRTAYDGDGAMAALDADVDYVCLDRRMPGMTGDEVVAEVRAGPHDPVIAIISAIEPDFDILDLEIERYLVKPITPPELDEVLEELAELRGYDDTLGRYDQLAHKCEALSVIKPDRLLARNERYQAVLSELAELAEEIEADLAEADHLPDPNTLL